MDFVAAGAAQDHRSVTAAARAAADAVWDFLAPGYGPHGGHRLLDLGDDVQLLKSPASGLNEQALDAALWPYQDVARSVRSAVGDHATVATLLAAGLVRRGLAAEEDGLPRAQLLEGLRLARRQVRASLPAQRIQATATESLARSVALGRDAIHAVVDGLRSWSLDSRRGVDLDMVDVVVEDVPEAQWSDGVLAHPQHGPDRARSPNLGVAVLSGGWSLKPRSSGVQHRIRQASQWGAALSDERERRRAALQTLQDRNVGLLVCGGAVDEELALQAARAGVWVWSDAPKDALGRLAGSTGATAVPDLDRLDGASVGRADVVRRPKRRGGVWVNGPAPSATLVLPSLLPVTQASVGDDGERLLRAAGAVLADPGALPGGGRWQRELERSLHAASGHAPGKQGLGMQVAAHVLGDVADLLVWNAGLDPLNLALTHDAESVLDPAVCVETAVSAGFDAAIGVLRVDGRYNKKASTATGLRGGSGKIGSPKGMPGDIPPLM